MIMMNNDDYYVHNVKLDEFDLNLLKFPYIHTIERYKHKYYAAELLYIIIH